MTTSKRRMGKRGFLRNTSISVLAVATATAFVLSSRSFIFATGSQRSLRAPSRSSHTACASSTELYDALGIDRTATVAEIKKAYYTHARDSHPDKFPGDDAMRDRFQKVADAYATLADPLRRQSYDLQGLSGLGSFAANATRLFGPPPWRVMIGRTDHWMWREDKKEYMVGLLAGCIPNGIAGVTVKTVSAAYDEAFATNVAILMDRVSEEQAKDTVEQIEEFGLAVKAEPIEGERTNENESPIQHFRRIQRELGEASERLRQVATDLDPKKLKLGGAEDEEFEKWIDTVRASRSELRAAAQGLEEFKTAKAAQEAR